MILRQSAFPLLTIALLLVPATTLAAIDPITLARDASSAGEHERAIRWYDEALAQNPGDEQALIGRIQALAALSRWDEVLNNIERSGLTSSGNKAIAVLQAEGLVKTGRPDEATGILDASPGIDKKDEIRIRAEALMAQGNLSQALSLLTKAEADGITDPRLALLSGIILSRKGNVTASLPYLEEAYLGLPESPDASASLGEAATALGMYEEALTFFTTAADQDPANSDVWVTIAFLLSRLGRFDEALQVLESPLSVRPTDSDLLNARAYTLYLAGRGSEGRSLAEMVLRQNPDDPGAMDTLGSILLDEGSVDEAVRYLEQANDLLPDDPEVLTHLGEAYHRLGRDAEAQDLFQKSLLIDSTSGRAWRGYSEVLLSLERYPEAATAIAEAFTYYPGDAELIAWEQKVDSVLVTWYLREEAEKNSTPFR